MVDYLVLETGQSRSNCECILESTLENVKKSVKKGGRVTLVGFGTFLRAKRLARKGRNPRTGDEIKIPQRIVAKFRPGKDFKDIAN